MGYWEMKLDFFVVSCTRLEGTKRKNYLKIEKFENQAKSG